ncbi:uncharacterized protein LOC111989727 [Quercus suber]|uniref:uncharacterized protein LOC111989727 n=1 Tax=Quercus suber TaxID=58331 RepID=UPI000CE234FB|nr:uncharacterized protein LOC111989727 [Quercus suber]
MGSEVRIVEVGNNIFQFKFNSKYQMEWVEKSGPWNFENNLLLLSRWKKGMTTANITFTHSPFWVQVWGLPFEFMFEDVGKEIGGKLGEVLEVDKHSWQADQAKFMRIRVNLPIQKSLRRGAHITNAKGERFWINFKYERLPTFCFICGKLGHDIKHCTQNVEGQQINQQYGEWIRAGGQGKGSADKARSMSSRSLESMVEEGAELRSGRVPKNRDTSVQTVSGRNEARNEARTRDQDLENMNTEMSNTIERTVQDGWDNMEKVEKVLAHVKEICDKQKGTKPDLVKELFKSNEEGCSLAGLPQKPNSESYGEKSPTIQKSGTTEEIKNKAQVLSSDMGKKAKAKGSLKKVAREMGKSQYLNKEAQVIIGGKKRAGVIEGLEESEGRVQKRVCEAHFSDEKEANEISAVAVSQPHQEQ